MGNLRWLPGPGRVGIWLTGWAGGAAGGCNPPPTTYHPTVTARNRTCSAIAHPHPAIHPLLTLLPVTRSPHCHTVAPCAHSQSQSTQHSYRTKSATYATVPPALRLPSRPPSLPPSRLPSLPPARPLASGTARTRIAGELLCEARALACLEVRLLAVGQRRQSADLARVAAVRVHSRHVGSLWRVGGKMTDAEGGGDGCEGGGCGWERQQGTGAG